MPADRLLLVNLPERVVTGIMFRGAWSLAEIYPRLMHHGPTTFRRPDVIAYRKAYPCRDLTRIRVRCLCDVWAVTQVISCLCSSAVQKCFPAGWRQ